jgi:hypothetical protein
MGAKTLDAFMNASMEAKENVSPTTVAGSGGMLGENIIDVALVFFARGHWCCISPQRQRCVRWYDRPIHLLPSLSDRSEFKLYTIPLRRV